MQSYDNILLSTAYFPPVRYFAHLVHAGRIFIEQMETYHKQTYRNRCEIMTASGRIALVVPVTKPGGNHTLAKDVLISYQQRWQKQHWRALESAYRSSPFFAYYSDLFYPFFERKETSLIRLNHQIIDEINRILGLKLKMVFTKDYIKKPETIEDLRTVISPKKTMNDLQFPEYPQVFSYKFGFMPDLSILDLLFNTGPETVGYLQKINQLLTLPL